MGPTSCQKVPPKQRKETYPLVELLAVRRVEGAWGLVGEQQRLLPVSSLAGVGWGGVGGGVGDIPPGQFDRASASHIILA